MSGAAVLDMEQKVNIVAATSLPEVVPMIRLACESVALASVAGFVWMVCQFAQFAG